MEKGAEGKKKKETLVQMLMKDDINRMISVAAVRSGSNSSSTSFLTFCAACLGELVGRDQDKPQSQIS